MKKYDFVLFDYNGTLIDDVDLNIKIENELLKRRNLTALGTKEFYLENFDFPIKSFYEKLGFDFSKESYDDICVEYAALYDKALESAKLFDDVLPCIKELKSQGKKLVIISAAEDKSLKMQTDKFGITPYFETVLGSQNMYGKTKIDTAHFWLEKEGADADKTVFIGDTVHDAETAESLGCDCFLVSRGHNSVERLKSTGCEVFENLKAVTKRLTEK